MPELPFDGKQSIQFLSMLDPGAKRFLFQTYDDNGDRKDSAQAKTYLDSFENARERLGNLSTLGASICVTIQDLGKSRKRRKQYVDRVRAIFCEWDEIPEGGASIFPIPPSFSVASSPGHEHHYWLLTTESALGSFSQVHFTGVMQRLIKDYGSDPGVKDVTRVLRLPGFPHQKVQAAKGRTGKPFLVHFIGPLELELGLSVTPRRYSPAEILKAFPPVFKNASRSDLRTFDYTSPEPSVDMGRVIDALSSMRDPDAMGYAPWVEVGMALHHATKGSRQGFQLWDKWSSRGGLYKEGECRQKWKSFNVIGEDGQAAITANTIYHYAAENGWNSAPYDFPGTFFIEKETKPFELPLIGKELYRNSDGVLRLLEREKLLIPSGEGDYVDIVCPNPEHRGDMTKGHYKPLFRGNQEDISQRKYHCSCGWGISDFVDYLHKKHKMLIPVDDPLSVDLERYILVVNGNQVYDVWQHPLEGEVVKSISLSDFRNAQRRLAPTIVKVKDSDGNLEEKIKYAELGLTWLSSSKLKRITGIDYRPDLKPGIFNRGESRYLNTYKKPRHLGFRGVPAEFLAHCEYILPDHDERETFLDWVAYKLQNPAARSYGVLMVADLPYTFDDSTTEEQRFGIGRGLLGKAISAAFQTGVTDMPLEDLIGKDGSVSFNDWAIESQLLIVQEAHSGGSVKDERKVENALRSIVDPSVTHNKRVNPKYGRIKSGSCYYNVLIFTNHLDALRLPKGDRRFFVLNNAKVPRPPEDYKRFAESLDDPKSIAILYHWFMDRDVSRFDSQRPPMTIAKENMIGASVSNWDEAWQSIAQSNADIIEADKASGEFEANDYVEIDYPGMTGDLVTKRQLIEEGIRQLERKVIHLKSESEVISMISQVWCRLPNPTLSQGDGTRVSLGSRVSLTRTSGRERIRILRNGLKWRELWEQESLTRSRGKFWVGQCSEELLKNEHPDSRVCGAGATIAEREKNKDAPFDFPEDFDLDKKSKKHH